MSGQQVDYSQPPLPPPKLPPLPYSPSPSTIPYQFGARAPPKDGCTSGSYQPQDFSFRAMNGAPHFPQEVDSYRPSRSGQYEMQPHSRQNSSVNPKNDTQRGLSNHGRRDNHRPQHSRYGKHHATSDRPLLQFKRRDTPERMLGMEGHEQTEKRFRDTDDMSDHEEHELALNIIETSVEAVDGIRDEAGRYVEVSAGELELNAATRHSAIAQPNAPKWSNPEYYTALPPPDESQRKKRDVVKLIRKARVVVEKVTDVNNQVATNDDFISFNAEEEQTQVGGDLDHSRTPRPTGNGVPGAPAGPRTSRYFQTQHVARSLHAPGTTEKTLSATSLGPPPGTPVGPSHNYSNTAAAALNGKLKRKRSIESVDTVDFRAPKRKKGAAGFSNGYVLEEWISPKSDNPIPWVTRDHRLTEQGGFRLHKEIIDFYEFVKPQEFEQIIRQELLDRLCYAIQDWRHDLEVHSFGSFAAGLYLPNADMDVVVISKDFRDRRLPSFCQNPKQMHQIAYYLVSKKICEAWSVEVIPKAKVPLIKFVDRITNIRVDMSFENDTGIVANRTFELWKDMYPAMPIIVTIVKQFLMMRGLNEVVNGGLGGFSVTCLVVSLLQNMPSVQTGEMLPERNLGEVLLEFLDLYGNQLDISRTAIRMDPPGYVDKRDSSIRQQSNPDRLAIIDPNQPENDISGGSRNVTLIFARFSRAREEVLNAMGSSNRASLLDWMVGGNYDPFIWQRAHLRKLHTQKWGRVDSEDVHVTTHLQDGVFLPRNAKAPQKDEYYLVSTVSTSAAPALPSIVGVRIRKKSTSAVDVQISILEALESDSMSQNRVLDLPLKNGPNADLLKRARTNLKAAKEAQRALLQHIRDDKMSKSSKWKTHRHKAHEVVLKLQYTVSTLMQAKESKSTTRDDFDQSRLSLDKVRDGKSPENAVSVISSNSVEGNIPVRRSSRIAQGVGGLTSRALHLSVAWHAERRAFLSKRQYSNVENVSLQLDPAGYNKLLAAQQHPEGSAKQESSKLPRKVDKATRRRHATKDGNTLSASGTTLRSTGIEPNGGTSRADAITID